MKIWLADFTYDQQVIAADTMPTNVAYVGLYAKEHFKKGDIDLSIFKYPGKFMEAMEQPEFIENCPDVIGFSNFMWNTRLNYKFVKRIRAIKPDTIIVFGGLNYKNDLEEQEKWFREHPLVDFYVQKEGEVAFLALLEALFENNMSVKTVKDLSLAGIHYLKNDGSLYTSPPATRVKDLTSIPSPYLTGTLDEFFDGKIMPVLTTNRGCPFTCAFCVEGTSYYQKINTSNLDRARAEIEYIGKKIAAMPELARRDLYISDSNFGMMKEDYQICEALRDSKKTYGWPQYIQATTGKNNKQRVLDAVSLLDGDLRISGSVQSLDHEVMKNIKRENIKHEDLLWLAKEAGKSNANSYSEIILALPGDSLVGHENSLKKIVNSGYDFVLAWQFILLPNTELDNQEARDKFGMKTKFRVLTKSYGNYPSAKGDMLSSFEIEEVCVAGNKLPFEDYLKARRLHLVINSFYNDRFFDGVLKILDTLGLERWSWVKKIAEMAEDNEELRPIFDGFTNETKGELKDSKEELISEMDNEKSVQAFVNGEAGKNLLAHYRLAMIIDKIDAVCDVAIQALKSVLEENGANSEEMEKFCKDLLVFERERRRNLFDPDSEKYSARLAYDMMRFYNDESFQGIDSYRLPNMRDASFTRSNDATELLRRNAAVFGNSRAALYKQITRTHIKKLYRDVTLV